MAKRQRFGMPNMPPATIVGNLNATQFEPPVALTTSELRGLIDGAITVAVAGTTRTLTDADNGKMLKFAQACTVTVPAGLRSDFSCGWSQESSGAVTFTASGSTITSFGNSLVSGGQYAIGGIAAFATNVYRLYGTLV